MTDWQGPQKYSTPERRGSATRLSYSTHSLCVLAAHARCAQKGPAAGEGMGEHPAPFSTSTSNEPPGLLLLTTFSGGPPSKDLPAPLGEALGDVELFPASSLERSLCTCMTGIQPAAMASQLNPALAPLVQLSPLSALLVSGARNSRAPARACPWASASFATLGTPGARKLRVRAFPCGQPLRARCPHTERGARSAVELAVEGTSEMRPEIAWRRLCAGAEGGWRKSIPGCAGASRKSHSSRKKLQLAMELESARRAARRAHLEPLRPRPGPWPHVRTHCDTRKGSVTAARARACVCRANGRVLSSRLTSSNPSTEVRECGDFFVIFFGHPVFQIRA